MLAGFLKHETTQKSPSVGRAHRYRLTLTLISDTPNTRKFRTSSRGHAGIVQISPSRSISARLEGSICAIVASAFSISSSLERCDISGTPYFSHVALWIATGSKRCAGPYSAAFMSSGGAERRRGRRLVCGDSVKVGKTIRRDAFRIASLGHGFSANRGDD